MAPATRRKKGKTSSDASARSAQPAPSKSASKDNASPTLASGQGGWAPISPTESIRPAMTATLMTLGLFMSVYIVTKSRLPNIKTYQPSTDMPFDWMNAKNHIVRMGKRYRFVGTAGLDDALEYIQSEMAALSEQANRNDLDLQLDWFQSAPSSFLTSVGPINIRNSYDNLSSIVVRVTPQDVDIDSRQPLLLNAHVDSAIGAPGVSDELSGVGVLMDIVRAVVSVPNDNDPQHQKHRLNRPVIFLFNGAEEVVLQGAHSFITQHPWGRKVAAHINLESLGSGNEYLVFRLGPKHPWLAHAYARSVSYPFASVTATDIYNTKLIPGETDFRIFDEFAGIPGFDFVYTDNGYIYHTRYDDSERLDNQGLLHAGVTVYELMMELAGKNDAIGAYLEGETEGETEASSPVMDVVRQCVHYVSSTFNSNHHDKPPNERQMVFFDVLHHYTVVYDEELAFFLHGSALVFAVLVWTIKIGSMPVTEWVSCFRMVYVYIIAMFCALLSSTYASIVYARALITPLIWYGSMTRAILVFGLPALAGLLTGMLNTLPRRLSRRHFEHALFGHSFILMVICFFLIRANVMSAYIPALCLFVSTLVAMQSPAVSPLNRHMQISVIHAVITCRLLTSTLSAILPIFGRVNIGSPEPMIGNIQVALPDIAVSVFVTVALFFHIGLPLLPILAYFAPAIRRLRSIFVAASLWTAFTLLIVVPKLNGHRERGIITPYSEVAPKRLSLMHFHAPQMYNTTDASPFSVLQVASMDVVDVNLERLCSNLAITSDADEGISSLPASPKFGSLDINLMESVHPFHMMIHHKHWLRSGNVPLLEVPTFEVEHESLMEGKIDGTDGQMEQNGDKVWNISVAIHAPDSHQVTIRMKSKDNGGLVSQWSFNSPLEDSSGFVWVKHSGSEKMRFWLIIPSSGSADNSDERPKVTMALSNMRLGKSRSPRDLMIIDKNVKPWESPFYLVSTAVEVEV